jgi:ribose transport system permease protein
MPIDQGVVSLERSPEGLLSKIFERGRLFDRFLDYGLFVALAVEIIVFWILSPYFMTVTNLLNIGSAVAVLGITAAGLTVALIGGVLDLSQAATVSMTTVVIAVLNRDHHFSIGWAIAVALLVAFAIGAINSVVVVGFGINSIIATLGMGTVLAGTANLLTNAQTVGTIDTGFNNFFFKRIAHVSVPLIIMAVVYCLAALLLYRTKLGWHIYAVGGNPSASLRAGINIAFVFAFLFVLSSSLAGVAGVVTAGLSNGGSSLTGGDILNTVTAVLLAGIGLSGGGGRIERTLAGVLFLGVLDNGLILMQVPSFWGTIMRGIALLVAVIMVSVRDRRLAR